MTSTIEHEMLSEILVGQRVRKLTMYQSNGKENQVAHDEIGIVGNLRGVLQTTSKQKQTSNRCLSV